MSEHDDMEGTRFKLYPQPSFLDRFADPEVVYVSSAAGSIMEGPADDRMYTMFPIDKPEPYGIAPNPTQEALAPPWDGDILMPAQPDEEGHFDHLEPGTPQFEAAHLFGCVRFVLDIWEGYFGRRIPWHSERHYDRIELSILPSLDNAYSGYGFIEVGGDFKHGGFKPFSLNFDVIAHEVGHAIIYSEVGVPDPSVQQGEYFGFHESASDLVALLSSLHFESVIDELLDVTSGNLYAINNVIRMGELSENAQIRIAANDVRLSRFARGWTKEHRLSEPLTGAFFDIFVDLFHECLLDYGAIDRRVEEASDELLATKEYAPIMQGMFDEAFAKNPEDFWRALVDARDILGTFLADTWQRLSANDLTYANVADAFLAVDFEHTGGRFESIIAGNFKMRDIGLVRVGPQLAPLDKDSHSNSIRTQLPVD